MLAACDIKGRDITADALLTQRSIAELIVQKGAHYHFTVKGNQPTLQEAIALYFRKRGAPDFAEKTTLAHGRIEQRRIGCTSELNDDLDFPHVGQCFLIERDRINKKTGVRSNEVVLGVTSRPADQASPKRLLRLNRGHWRIEAKHHKMDWNYDEDRSRIRTGHGPANTSRLRHFALSVLKSFQKPHQSIASMMRRLARRPRTVLDYLRLTANSGAATGTSE